MKKISKKLVMQNLNKIALAFLVGAAVVVFSFFLFSCSGCDQPLDMVDDESGRLVWACLKGGVFGVVFTYIVSWLINYSTKCF